MTLVADAQRERALESLRRHYQEGRLDADELDTRADRALRARTTAELRWAMRDLPSFGELLERGRQAAGTALYLGALAVSWGFMSLLLLVVFGVLAFSGDAGAGELLAVPALWAAMSVGLVLAGSRRLRRR